MSLICNEIWVAAILFLSLCLDLVFCVIEQGLLWHARALLPSKPHEIRVQTFRIDVVCVPAYDETTMRTLEMALQAYCIIVDLCL